MACHLLSLVFSKFPFLWFMGDVEIRALGMGKRKEILLRLCLKDESGLSWTLLSFLLLYIVWALYFYFHSPPPPPWDKVALCSKQSLPLNLQSFCSSLLSARITGLSHQALLLCLYRKGFTFPSLIPTLLSAGRCLYFKTQSLDLLDLWIYMSSVLLNHIYSLFFF